MQIGRELPESLSDPDTGEWSDVDRGRINIVHIILGLGLLAIAGVVLGAVAGIIAYAL